MNTETSLDDENAALRRFVTALGFDPQKVVMHIVDKSNTVCKNISLSALRVERDFSRTNFTQAGIDASNAWLDKLI